MKWINAKEAQPKLKDDSILCHFSNGSIETCHIEDMFEIITIGINEDGTAQTKYRHEILNQDVTLTHWMVLPEPPVIK